MYLERFPTRLVLVTDNIYSKSVIHGFHFKK
jgi:hypothetical protein